MRFTKLAVVSLLLASAPLCAKGASQPAPNVAAAVAATADRTPDNVKLDEGRKPAELLTFFGLRQGMQVLDMFGANKYWSEIIAPAIGPTGHGCLGSARSCSARPDRRPRPVVRISPLGYATVTKTHRRCNYSTIHSFRSSGQFLA